jgi:anaerobic dimethyl sulfoxide reductase subunit C (anchor subunit)
MRSVGRRRYGDALTAPVVARLLPVLFVTAAIAIGGAHFHLSKPFLSFLAVLNVRTSWLSREVLFTMLFVGGLGLLVLMNEGARQRPRLYTALGWLTITCGFASVLCMGYIYLMPTQPAWNSPLTILSFYTTTLLLGVAAMTALLLMDLKVTEVRAPESVAERSRIMRRVLFWFAAGTLLLAVVVFALNLAQLARLRHGGPLTQISLELLLGVYQPLLWLRVGLLAAGVAWLLGAAGLLAWRRKRVVELVVPVYMACLLVLVGEILARFLFYAAHVRTGL